MSLQEMDPRPGEPFAAYLRRVAPDLADRYYDRYSTKSDDEQFRLGGRFQSLYDIWEHRAQQREAGPPDLPAGVVDAFILRLLKREEALREQHSHAAEIDIARVRSSLGPFLKRISDTIDHIRNFVAETRERQAEGDEFSDEEIDALISLAKSLGSEDFDPEVDRAGEPGPEVA